MKAKVIIQAAIELSLFFAIIMFILIYSVKGFEYFAKPNTIILFIGMIIGFTLFILASISFQYSKIKQFPEEELEYYKNPPWKKLLLTSVFWGIILTAVMMFSMKNLGVIHIFLLFIIFTLFYFVLKSYIFRFYRLSKKAEKN